MATDNQHKTEKFPVREGQEDSSVLNDKKPASRNAYPRPDEKDKRVKNQPEFTEEQPNRISPSSPAK